MAHSLFSHQCNLRVILTPRNPLDGCWEFPVNRIRIRLQFALTEMTELDITYHAFKHSPVATLQSLIELSADPETRNSDFAGQSHGSPQYPHE